MSTYICAINFNLHASVPTSIGYLTVIAFVNMGL